MRLLLLIVALFTITGQVPARDLASVVERIMAEPRFQETGLDTGSRLASRIREEYQQDESAILRDALAFKPTEEINQSIFYGFWTELGIGTESRISLIETLISPAAPGDDMRAAFLLGLSDRKITPGTEQDFEADLSRHASWGKGEENLPQEYLLYLFKQDGEQAWKLLGGSPDRVAALGGLSELIARNESSMLKVRSWIQELSPALLNGLPLEKQRDLAYLAWFLGMLYGSEDLAQENNPKLAEWIEKGLPGVGKALMNGAMADMAAVKHTSAKDATAWVDRMREKAGVRPRGGSSSLASDVGKSAGRRKAEQSGAEGGHGGAGGNSLRNLGLGAALLLLAVASLKFLHSKKAAR